MKPAGTLILALVIVVGALAAYHFIFHADDGNGQGDESSGVALERELMVSELARTEGLFGQAYDKDAMRAIVAKAGITLTAEQEAKILPMLHAHLLELQRNLHEARDAAVAGRTAARRGVYRARAAQAHSRFQAELGKLIPRKDAMALFRAYPSMIPPVPGSTGAARTKPYVDPRSGMPLATPTDGEKK